MDDKEIIGRSDYIKLLILVGVMAVPVALLTLIFLALYTKGGQFVRETLPAALHISQPLCTILVATLGGLLVGSSAPAEEEAAIAEPAPTVEIEIATIKNELAAMRQLLEKIATGGDAE